MEHAGDGKKRKLDDESNGEAVPLSKEDLKQLLAPLSKEQLVSLLVNAGCQYPAIADDIRDVASKDPAHRKLFVRGLAWETASQTLREAFEQYGEIEEGAVIIDKATGKSRGFGFITFKHMDSAQRALKEPSKTIDGRITVCNLATAGTNPTQASDQSQRKLYIGGLSYDTTNEALISLFSQYGEIEEGSVAYDKNSNKSRGFAFVTFKMVEAAKRALEEPNKTIDGRAVTVKLAIEGQKEKTASQPAPSPQMAMVPQVQPGYAAVNPNLTPYPRPQVPPPVQTIGFQTYPAGLPAYATQPTYVTQPAYGPAYGGLSAAQYGAVAPAQYNPTQYAHYAAGQAGLPTAGTPAAGVPPYYTS
eukprot:Gb_23748 [translate_table: standard]